MTDHSINRRQFTVGAGMGALGMALGQPLAWAKEDDVKRPNIIMIIADNLGVESVGTYGGDLFKTPRIDSIGHDGIIFDQCYIGTPLCSPARAGLMTGRYPQCAGVHGQPSPGSPEKGGLDLNEITVANVLKDAGYDTAIFGKWNLGYHPKFLPTHRGFDTYYGINAGHADYYTHIYDRDGKKYFYEDTEPVDPEGYVDNLCTDRAVEYIESHRESENPFFMTFAFFTPHGPYQSPPGYPSDVSTDEKYAQMIDNMDRLTGRMLDALEETGLADNTLVFFISDQGSSRMNPYKRDLTEGGLKVVCHAKWPATIKKGVRVDTPIISYDWFTTFAKAGGAEIPQDRLIVGKDASHLFDGKGKCAHDAFFWHYGNEDAIRVGDLKLHLKNEEVDGLYDLSKDPKAERDLSADHPKRVADLKARLIAWKADMCSKPER
jgi:arylsulfatase A-like enzyme